jgi:hypothetical protein
VSSKKYDISGRIHRHGGTVELLGLRIMREEKMSELARYLSSLLGVKCAHAKTQD